MTLIVALPIGRGDALGGNVVNVGLIRGLALRLLGSFCAWLAVALRSAFARPRAQAPATDSQTWRAAISAAVGLALLFAAGYLIVEAARGLVAAWGAPFLVGATLVAFGTSMPERVTMLVARLRGRHEVGLGTLLGSNRFNGLVIVPVAARVHPIDVALLAACAGSLLLLLARS